MNDVANRPAYTGHKDISIDVFDNGTATVTIVRKPEWKASQYCYVRPASLRRLRAAIKAGKWLLIHNSVPATRDGWTLPERWEVYR